MPRGRPKLATRRPKALVIDKATFLEFMPELRRLPDIDVKVLLLHCMGMGSGDIAQHTCLRKDFIEGIIQRHDPQGTLALNEHAKHAVIKMQLTNAIGVLTGTLWNLEEIQCLPYIDRVRAVKELISAMQMVRVVLPKNTDAASALERLKNHGRTDEGIGDRRGTAVQDAEVDVGQGRRSGDDGRGDRPVQPGDDAGESVESLGEDA